MRNLWTLTVREWKAFWYSPIAYVVGTAFLFLQGWVFWFLVSILNDPRVDPSINISHLFFGTMWYWFSIVMMAPLLTMRSFSEEKRTGTIEVLLAAPVTDVQVVASKFLGAWLSYCMLWAMTVVYFVLVSRTTTLDWGPVGAGYLCTALLGGVFISLGVFASSTTRNQVVAGFISFVLILLLFSISLLGIFMRDPQATKTIQYLSMLDHVRDFSRGIFDTRPIVFYLSVITAALFLTVRAVGNPRWRA